MSDLESKQIHLELKIEADPATVWNTMINEIGEWWPADYRALGAPAVFHFEARPGGGVWEESETGGLEWFSVQALEEEKWVNLVGFTAPPWGGPSITMLRIDLAEGEGGSTVFRVSDASLGRLPDPAVVEEGWRVIFGGLQEAAKRSKG